MSKLMRGSDQPAATPKMENYRSNFPNHQGNPFEPDPQHPAGVYIPVLSEIKGHYERMNAMPPKQKAIHKIKGCAFAIGGGAVLMSILCILAGEWATTKAIMSFALISMFVVASCIWGAYMIEK